MKPRTQNVQQSYNALFIRIMWIVCAVCKNEPWPKLVLHFFLVIALIWLKGYLDWSIFETICSAFTLSISQRFNLFIVAHLVQKVLKLFIISHRRTLKAQVSNQFCPPNDLFSYQLKYTIKTGANWLIRTELCSLSILPAFFRWNFKFPNQFYPLSVPFNQSQRWTHLRHATKNCAKLWWSGHFSLSIRPAPFLLLKVN